ncbi:regulator [Alkalihalobacillus alcalophilus ATCC 27647 = CGMCC 1.3604]|uniref:Regulator n=1 Tax=Alkalihalobacillus alcalophilus ATCC 27647 = CGMCC 1.3604 TaxID=1218173 RepID=A0A094WJ07_ALKAL|nr:response regulator transcription factor [Alkalihalobacillus alcalophilus]KGA96806.1 regulator [Alkalihalobacillus alcalophilus ATCC 27647 = CGMCC 1.3604]MED1561376.1 response regulator transcription factor [Alkalihalobacillus alcalophilus]THG92407.1 regulator [Alkalihalobacillus alcalophilus ATCC 27647 = CGMCC 1.3604]
MNDKAILLVEDDPEIARIVCDDLRKNGFVVTWSSTGQEGLEDFKKGEYTLVLIDLMLPELDGFTLCKLIRDESDIPLLIISAKIADQDKIKGLNLGADDYLTKPFSLDELKARIHSHLRRYNRYKGIKVESPLYHYKGGLTVDFEKERIYIANQQVPLTAKEKGIFFLLAKKPFQTFSKRDIYLHVWYEPELDNGKTVTVHLKSLRTKLKESSRNPLFIQTVWGIGYQFIGEEVE